jgi:hypothetical protein
MFNIQESAIRHRVFNYTCILRTSFWSYLLFSSKRSGPGNSIPIHCFLPDAAFSCVFTLCTAYNQRWVIIRTGIRLRKGYVRNAQQLWQCRYESTFLFSAQVQISGSPHVGWHRCCKRRSWVKGSLKWNNEEIRSGWYLLCSLSFSDVTNGFYSFSSGGTMHFL